MRREPLHPGAQQTLDDIDGARFTCFLTDQTDADLARLDARHRAHARVEDRIRGAKDTGARNLPADTFARNAVWLQLVLTAQDLMTFRQALTLDGRLRLAEPATLRYQLLHAPARLVRHARRWRLDIQHDWHWADELVAAFPTTAFPARAGDLTAFPPPPALHNPPPTTATPPGAASARPTRAESAVQAMSAHPRRSSRP